MTTVPVNTKCHYCNVEIANTWDHIIPRFRGGPRRAKWNLVPSCESCNIAKGASMPFCTCAICAMAVRKFREGYQIQKKSGWIDKQFEQWYKGFTPRGYRG